MNTCDARRRVVQDASKAIEKIHSARELFCKEYENLEEEVTKQAEELEKQVHEHTNQQVRKTQFNHVLLSQWLIGDRFEKNTSPPAMHKRTQSPS